MKAAPKLLLAFTSLVLVYTANAQTISNLPQDMAIHKELMPFVPSQYGSDTVDIPKTPKNKVTIWVNPKIGTGNFTSSQEGFYRYMAKGDERNIVYAQTTPRQIIFDLETLRKQKAIYLKQADSVHRMPNPDKMLIYFVNNTDKRFYVQMQDGAFIGILEAQDKDRHWKPAQRWQLSTCGNSYAMRYVFPHKAVPFIVPALIKGDYQTKLRYKILGRDKFYYSNEFEGRINYSDIDKGYDYPEKTLETFKLYALDFNEIVMPIDGIFLDRSMEQIISDSSYK